MESLQDAVCLESYGILSMEVMPWESYCYSSCRESAADGGDAVEQITRHYGIFFLRGLVVVLLLSLIFGSSAIGDQAWSIREFIREALEPEEVSVSDSDLQTFITEGAVDAPVFAWRYKGVLYTGTYELQELVSATDYAGRELMVRLENISVGEMGDAAGDGVQEENEEENVEIDGDRITFLRLGIYCMRLMAKDDKGHCAVCEIRIPVNGGV